MLKVGDHVLVVRDGYLTEGIRTGDVVVVTKVGVSSVLATGLPGTAAASDYPIGLYFDFACLKLVHSSETQEETVMDILEVDKYYIGTDNLIYGPLQDRGTSFYCPTNGVAIRKDGSFGYNRRVKEVLDEGGAYELPVEELKIGMLARRHRGDMRFIRVLFNDPSVSQISHHNGSYSDFDSHSYMSGTYTVYPKYQINIPGAEGLEGKWYLRDGEYRKINSIRLSGEEGLFPKGLRINSTAINSNWSSSQLVNTLEGLEVFDDHPMKEGMVNHIQGDGPFLYAVDRVTGEVLLACQPYGSDVVLFSSLEHNSCSYGINPSGGIWYRYNLFHGDTAPIGYPFGGEAYKNTLEEFYNEGFNDFTRWVRDNVGYQVALKAVFHKARMATTTRGNVALYLNESQLKSGKIQSLRAGRAFKFLMPDIKDADLEKLVDKFRKDFPVGDYAVKRGFEAADFKHAYGHTSAPMQNPRTTYERKSLGNSCMRHDFSRLPHHPAEAYASGEFEMLWSETPEGRIASRLVVWHPPVGHKLHGKPQGGPVYGVCEYSISLLEDILVGMGGDKYNNATWRDAKMQKLPHDGGVIAPYLDHEQSLEDMGDWLKVGGDCDYEACTYDGVLGGRGDRTYCDECDDTIDTDYDGYYHTDRGCLCESCYERYYFYCQHYEEDYPIEDRCVVYVKTMWGRESRYVCTDARDQYYTLCTDGEYWESDDVIILANGEAVSPMDIDDAVMCDFNDEYYLLEDTLTTWDDRVMSKDYFNDNLDSYTLNDDGVVVEVATVEEEAA